MAMANAEAKEESGSSTLQGPSSEDRRISWRDYLMQNIDPVRSTTPLACFCFMTGFMWVSYTESHEDAHSMASQ